MNYELIIIGGGPAGLAAAIEAKKNGLEKILILERDRELGGILQQCIHNGFGLHVFKEELTGPEYAQRFIDELHSLGIEYKLDTMVLSIAEDRSVTALNSRDGLLQLQVGAIILAMGCRERTRGALAIPGTRPAGVFTAGTAQRFVNMEGYMVGRKVVILGSGDIGLIMARRLTLEGAEVLAVAELMPYSGGLNRNIVQCLHDYDIPLLLSHTVVDIQGQKRVEAVTIARVDENLRPLPGTEKRYECDTLLLSVGLIPENELSREVGIELDPRTGGPVVTEALETSAPGIFACGNVVHVHDLADWVSEEAQRAARGAARYLQGIAAKGARISARPGPGVRYVVPQQICRENLTGKIELLLRVTDIYNNARLQVKSGDKVIKSLKRLHMAPGEMESVKLAAEDLTAADSITVQVEEATDK
ncbi:MAG: FAD-dependent oxidoreductase [Firmicutes bacterium]|nr:FAD-dependent oxidoreductase [Bacillota bacterium]